MSDELRQQLSLLAEYLGQHLILTLTALSIGISLSLPLALLVLRVGVLKGPVLAVAGAIQTIPSIALLALMVPLLGQIGFLPAVIALILYTILPVLRNTVTGIEDVDPNLIEAGRGLGMKPTQLLFRVQIPLAMPVIIAGIRTATVWVVGIATLSTPVGQTSLGDYIFSGLQLSNDTAVYVGCAAAIVLALTLDGLIRLMQIASIRRSRPLAITAVVGLVLVVGGGLVPAIVLSRSSDERPTVVIGGKTFTEQYIVSALLAEQLEAEGYRAQVLKSLGSTIVFDALVAGRVDCYVDYTGTIWANYMNREDQADADEVLVEITSWLKDEHGIECLGRLGFENTYALAMPRADAQRLEIETIDDLFRHSSEMTIGGDYEFFGRPEWQRLVDAYNLSFADTVGMDGTLMYSAVETGDIDLIAAFSTDGRIAANDLVVLEDPRGVFPPYDAVILLGPNVADDQALINALQPLIGLIDDDQMRQANMQIDVNGRSVEQVASELHDALD